jgi:hypothetical protein
MPRWCLRPIEYGSLLGRALPASACTRPKTTKYVSHYWGRQNLCQKDAANKNHFDLILGVGRSSLRSLYLPIYDTRIVVYRTLSRRITSSYIET